MIEWLYDSMCVPEKLLCIPYDKFVVIPRQTKP